MKKAIIICFMFSICVFFVSCTTTEALYKSKMQSMKIEEKNDYKTVETETNCYRDSILEMCINLDEDSKNLIVKVENYQDYKIKILWDEAVIVTHGNSSPVIHEGTKFIDKNAPQLPSVVLGGTNFLEYICPSDNVYWVNSTQYTSGYWAKKQMIYDVSYDQDIIVSIPIEYQDKKITYTSKLVANQEGTKKVYNVFGTAFAISGGIIGVTIAVVLLILL